MAAHDTQSFFTPDAFLCKPGRLLSEIYNLAHVLLARSQSEHVFIPIRSLQYLAIIEKDVFWFVDSQAYAVKDDEGGRLITISWRPVIDANEREGLNQHMDCNITFYGKDMSDIQTRLQSEFHQSMKLIDQRYRDSNIPSSGARILTLNTTADRKQ